MPRPKDSFDTLYRYQLYEPAEVLESDLMYTLPEVARCLQNLSPEVSLDEETEARLIAWTLPWIVLNEESFVINDPEGDEPGYFGLSEEVIADAASEEADEELDDA